MQSRNIVPCVSSKLLGIVPYSKQTQFAQETPYITGVTRDSAGNALPGCFVDLFTTADDTLRLSTLSDLVTGAFSFQVGPGTGTYYCIAIKPGLPEVGGISVDSLSSTSAAFNATLTTGCSLWVKGDVLGATLTDGTLIDSWTDSSGNSNTLTQATDANKPRYYSKVVNGLPVARFDSPGVQFLQSATLGPSKPVTFFAVCRVISSDDTDLVIFHDHAVVDINLAISQQGNPIAWAVLLLRDNATVFKGPFTFATGTWVVIETTYSSSGEYAFYVNGALTATGTNDQTVGVGTGQRQIGNNSQGFCGDFAEGLQFNSVLSAADRSIVRTYLGRKYAITVAGRS